MLGQTPSIEGRWQENGDEWRYILSDGSYLKSEWLNDRGLWYYFNGSGYMHTGKRRIDSKTYYFNTDGSMLVGWVYDDEEEVWYHAGENGELTKGWLRAGDAWYWFDSRFQLYDQGERMVDGHKYYFFENGQLAANQYVGLDYYDENGLRNRDYSITIQGKRRPTEEEKKQITEAMAGIPREWIKKFNDNGWEIMFYTDRSFYSAPSTDQGIYYVYHKTDTNYKKLKFTNPNSLAIAFGEYVASETDHDTEENSFMADYHQYMMESSMAQPLPSYFDDNIAMQFGSLFEAYCRPEVRADMKRVSPDLYEYLRQLLGINREGQRPSDEDLIEMSEDPGISSNGIGPGTDQSLKNRVGPGQPVFEEP